MGSRTSRAVASRIRARGPRPGGRQRGVSCSLLAAAFVAALSAPGTVSSQTPSASQPGLDDLLRLPDSYEADDRRRGGLSPNEWRKRFTTAQRDVADAEAALEEAQEQLVAAAGDSSQWQPSAPGQKANPENSPGSFRHRAAIDRAKEALEESQRRQRALQVEADLAGVPDSWRRPAQTPSRAGSSLPSGPSD